MKTAFVKPFWLTLLCSVLVISAFAAGGGVDLSSRQAVYLTGNKSVIDLRRDKYVASGARLYVKKSEVVSCKDNQGTFNLVSVAFWSDGSGTLKTYGQFTGKTIGSVGNTIFFSDGEKTRQQVLPVPLIVGVNPITFTIDPNKEVVETDETNNSFTVTIIVEP